MTFSKKLGVIVFLMVAGIAAARCWAELPINELTEAERRSGWQLLFDGKSADQWRSYQKETLSDGWQVVEGAIVRVKAGGGDIVTKKAYENFELSIEYKISKGGNSGIMFHVSEDEPAPWHTGPEIQIQDNVDGHDPQKSGWLYQLYQPAKPNWLVQVEKEAGLESPTVPDTTRPAGEWNHIYARISSMQSQVAVNGVTYYSFVQGSQEWNELVAKSKFAKFPKFGKNETGHICLQDHGNEVAFRNIKIRVLPADGSVPNPVDGQLAVKAVEAFPNLTWEGWQGTDEKTGKTVPLRPIVLTHGGDGTNRIFVATQRGTIHVFPNDPDCRQTKLFLDIKEKIQPWEKGNEEGLLGLALHPKYKDNGQFFVYYTSVDQPRKSVVSRFNVSKDDANKADPASEQIIMEIPQPFANHNGGSIAFGKDGYLYIALGDGGAANDPLLNGQNLGTWLGSVLRIDVDHKSDGRNYGIPADNPFLDRDGAKPEIFAYGLRNVWRLSVDRETGDIWIGDVGQDLWEEINVLKPGGNYGWNIREATHLFGNDKPKNPEQPIDPVWEYDHQIGKSITGGFVYRGTSVPELQGMYLYADYVSGKVWALEYDVRSGKLKRNMSIPSNGIPILAFGEDEMGEIYFLCQTVSGKDMYKFASGK